MQTNIKLIFLKYLKHKKLQQVSALFSSSLLLIPAGMLISILNARYLGKEAFGDLKFIQSIFNFLIPLTTFGLYSTSAKLIASENNYDIKKQLIGVSNLCAVLVSLLVSILIFIYSFYHNKFYDNNLGSTIRYFSFFFIVLFLLKSTEKLFIGDNKINSLALFRLFPKIFRIILILSFSFFFFYNLTTALFAFYISAFIVLMLRLKYLRPSFKNFRKTFNLIFEENKRVGLPIYIGAVFGVGSGHLAGLIIGYYSNNIDVGFYSLSLIISAPMAFIPRAIGESYYKEFANRRNITAKLIMLTILISIISIIGFNLLLKPVVLLFYSKEYLQAVILARFTAWAMLFYGFGDLFNKFLASNGKGKFIRNGAIASGIVSLIGYFVFIRIYGTMGAVITKVIAALVYLIFMLFYYKKSQ